MKKEYFRGLIKSEIKNTNNELINWGLTILIPFVVVLFISTIVLATSYFL